MSNIEQEEKYLKEVLELLDEKLAALNQKVDVTEKDMADFHEYFWNSYTEFDEYGYELYDNTNAIRQKIRQKGDYIREKFTFERMKDSPYFGRVDFLDEYETEPDACYIGISNLSKSVADLPVVYDWRAPISSLFYDFDSGEASYEAPGGTISGRITDKYQYKISGGRLIYMLQSDMNIDDEILKEELGTHASASLKAIVSTIQKEQNRIIRDTSHNILAVQGCAGSGKTSVALHRIAYLLYHNRKTLKASQILILSPCRVFSDYISRILPELGEENICEMTLDLWACRRLRHYGEVQDRYDAIEEKLDPEVHPFTGTAEAEYKHTEDYVKELDGFIMELESNAVDIREFRYRGRTYSASYISELFYEKLWQRPLMERMKEVAEFIIDEEETLRNKDMSSEEKQMIIDALENMYTSMDLIGLYNEFLESTGRRPLETYRTGYEEEKEDEYEYIEEEEEKKKPKRDTSYLRAKLIPYEDMYPLLYMMYSLWKNYEERPVKHLVIDEMQDYSYLQYRLIEKIFPCAMTILGDKAQTMEEKERDVLTFLPKIFGKGLYSVELSKSYRSTKEITEYAAGIAGFNTANSIDRHGSNVETFSFDTDKKRMDKLVDVLKGCIKRDDTIAVLTINERRAKAVYNAIKDTFNAEEINLLTANTSKFNTGISVAPFYLSKGLEFDGVCIVDDHIDSEALHKQAMYIEATRALHELYVFKCE